MVEDGAVYALLGNKGNCTPVFPNNLNPEFTPSFDDVCPLRPATYEENKLVPYRRGLAPVSIKDAVGNTYPNSELNYERNARLSIRALADYSAALQELVEARDPGQVGKSVGDTVSAVQGLADAAASVQNDRGLSAKAEGIFSTASQLFDRLTREVLEARRFEMLSEIVRASDPLVQDLSEAAALWFYQTEKDALETAYRNAMDAAYETTAQGNKTVQVIEDAEVAIATARRMEAAARWRVFWGVAVAHHAILKSLDAPPNLELLIEANTRISDLVAATDAFVKAAAPTRK